MTTAEANEHFDRAIAVPAGTGTLALLQRPAWPDQLGDDAAPGDRAAPQWPGCLVGCSAGG